MKIILIAALLFAAVLVLAPSSSIGILDELYHHLVLATAAVPMAVQPQLFTVSEVCTLLSIRTTTVYSLIAKGDLDAIKIGSGTRFGRGTRITAQSVQRLLAAAPKVEIKGKSYLTLKTRRRLAREQGARA
jgi:excisionase family DNA binding protein